MIKRDYERLTIEKFGRHLITSGDLDPVYIALPKAITDVDQRARWMVAYWCYYHCGVASFMSEYEGEAFWKAMMVAAENVKAAPNGGRWPRGSERRHARGMAGIRMVASLQAQFGNKPEQMVHLIHDYIGDGIDFPKLAKYTNGFVLFGPWVSFKIGDMMERIEGCPVNFTGADIFMFKDPTKAAVMVYKQKAGLPENVRLKDEPAAIRQVVDYLREEFKDLAAPPNRDRGIELQEIETTLCKFKSHLNGHYPLNNDIIEISEGLEGWGKTAASFRYFMPKAI